MFIKDIQDHPSMLHVRLRIETVIECIVCIVIIVIIVNHFDVQHILAQSIQSALLAIMAERLVTPLQCGLKGIGLFFRKDCKTGDEVVDQTYPFLHVVNHSCRPNSRWVSSGMDPESGLPIGKARGK